MSDIGALVWTRMVDITPSDAAPQFATQPCGGFVCDGAGTVRIRLVGEKAPTSHQITVLAGVEYHYAVLQFYATGTSATGIHAVGDPVMYQAIQ